MKHTYKVTHSNSSGDPVYTFVDNVDQVREHEMALLMFMEGDDVQPTHGFRYWTSFELVEEQENGDTATGLLERLVEARNEIHFVRIAHAIANKAESLLDRK